MRRLSSSTSSTTTSTSCEVEDDLARVDVLLGPAHLADVDQALDARLELDERAVLGDVGHAARELGAQRILARGALPGIALELLHAQRDALRVAVDADDLHLHRVADAQHLARVLDALVAEVGDVEQAVDAAQVDEGAVIGDVLDHAVDHLALGEALDQARTLLGARLFEHGAARHDDVAALAVHLEDLEGLGGYPSAASRRAPGGCRPAAGQEGDGAVEVDGEAALDAAEDHALDARGLGEFGFELVPAASRRARSRLSIASPFAFSTRST